MPPHFYVENKPYSRTDQLRQQLAELDAGVGKHGHGMGQDTIVVFNRVSESEEESGDEEIAAIDRIHMGQFLVQLSGSGEGEEDLSGE